MSAVSKTQKRIQKWKREGLSQEEIERRLAQSATSKAVQGQNLRQHVKARASKLVVREGETAAAQEKYAMLSRKGRNFDMQMNEYLRSIAHPAKFGTSALIPDPTTFPRGIAQLRSVITASTWRSETTPGGDDEVFLVCFPGLNNCFDGYHGRFEMDGTEYTDSAFDVHDYTNWNSLLQCFRPISMCVDVTYISSALENKGQVAIACFPAYQSAPASLGSLNLDKLANELKGRPDPETIGKIENFLKKMKEESEKSKKTKLRESEFDEKTMTRRGKKLVLGDQKSHLISSSAGVGASPSLNFETVSEYNYSYTGAARDGAYQIWMPDSSRCFLTYQPSSTMESLPYIVFAAKGCTLPEAGSGAGWLTTEAVFRIEVTLNIETYSVVQLLTANQLAGKPDALKLSHALATVSKAHYNGNANTRGTGGDSVYAQIAGIARQAAGFVWDNRAMIPSVLEGAAALLG